MKKFLFSLCVFTMSVTAISAEDKPAPTRIECELIPLFRGSPKPNSENNSNLQSTSTNWSGYAAATNLAHPQPKSVTRVVGSWTVPAVSSTVTDAYSSIWVGIDGYKSPSVQQIGTEQDWIGGEAQYYAWYEMFPANSHLIQGFPVAPGDEITAKVLFIANGVYELSIRNVTQNVYTVIPKNKTTSKNLQRSSAEWIVEAPSSQQGVLPLANFGTAQMYTCKATINGIKGSINQSNWQSDAITMEAGSVIKAVPSSLSSNGQDFSVEWMNE